MSEPFLAEIKLMSFNFAPRGWALCNGQLLPINQNQALFSLLGTTYGGDGRTNFGLPDLRGRVPIHRGAGFSQGQRAGAESHTLTIQETPAHDHVLEGSSAPADAPVPFNVNTNQGLVFANSPDTLYGPPTDLVATNAQTVANTGGSQPHPNMQPYLTLNYCIALQGIFPSPN